MARYTTIMRTVLAQSPLFTVTFVLLSPTAVSASNANKEARCTQAAPFLQPMPQ
jgi:hypothetical protein